MICLQFPCYAFEYTTTTKTCVLSNITTLMINGGYLGLRKSPVMQFFERSKGKSFYPFYHMTSMFALGKYHCFINVSHLITFSQHKYRNTRVKVALSSKIIVFFKT